MKLKFDIELFAVCVIIFMIGLLLADVANAADLQGEWGKAETRLDGSPFPIEELAGTEIMWDCDTGTGSVVAPPDKFSIDLAVRERGTCMFTMRHIDIYNTPGAGIADAGTLVLPAESPPGAPIIIRFEIKIEVQ